MKFRLYLSDCIENGFQAEAIYIYTDFRKAFDTIGRSVLIGELKSLETNGGVCSRG